MQTLECSVIIATRNRPHWLEETLNSFTEQRVAEIIVVDQSDEPFRALVREMIHATKGAVYVDSPLDGLPAARNRGLKHASEDIVVFLDDDVRVMSGCLEAHVQCYSDPQVGAVAGRIIEQTLRPNREDVGNGMNRIGLLRTNLDGEQAQWISAVKGANMSFRKSTILSLGGFDTAFQGTAYLEEVDMSERLQRKGLKIRFEPKASVIHYAAPAGGVRTGSAFTTERWRFQNTGYFVGKHRSRMAGRLIRFTYVAVACKRFTEWHDVRGSFELIRAFSEGLHDGWKSANSQK